MMSKAHLIFPHQLFQEHPAIADEGAIYLIEEELFFNQYRFHKKKLQFHRASMKFYASFLEKEGKEVNYINAQEEESDVRNLIKVLSKEGVEEIFLMDPVDDWLNKRIQSSVEESEVEIDIEESMLFINNKQDLRSFFKEEDAAFHQTEFYIQQRKKLDILLDENDKPVGGKWSFDPENRKKYPKGKKPPAINYPSETEYHREATKYVENYYSGNPGNLNENMRFPVTFEAAEDWFQQFLEMRFQEFGPYEDAIVSSESILNHAVLTPILNTGLISVDKVLDMALEYIEENDVPINTAEGFIRQIIGWREFIRGIYITIGEEERTKNFWNFDRKMPESFYTAETGIDPLDDSIEKVLNTAYSHHIERLMIIGNFMLLCEFDPDEVYQWFMEMYIDAYDWVMVPNVYGMSQFADGGMMSTKPYISGSNYIKKMSDYKGGEWSAIWDALFWRFMHVHRDFFEKNNRMRMLLSTFDRFSEEKQEGLLKRAEEYLSSID